MSWLNITIDELEFMSGGMNEEEMNIVAGGGNGDFSHARKIIEIRNKYLRLYKEGNV
jgi:hypothetical protein